MAFDLQPVGAQAELAAAACHLLHLTNHRSAAAATGGGVDATVAVAAAARTETYCMQAIFRLLFGFGGFSFFFSFFFWGVDTRGHCWGVHCPLFFFPVTMPMSSLDL